MRVELAARLRARRPDVVHIHNTFPLLSPAVLAAGADAGVPAVATLHENVLDDTARSPRDQACFRALLAGHPVSAGDPEQAIHHGLMIVPELGAPLVSIRPLQALRPVRDAAATSGVAGATDFCEKFDTAARTLRAA